jgi:hypothetical protein
MEGNMTLPLGAAGWARKGESPKVSRQDAKAPRGEEKRPARSQRYGGGMGEITNYKLRVIRGRRKNYVII